MEYFVLLNYIFIIFSDVEKTEKEQESTASKLSFRNSALVLDGLKDNQHFKNVLPKNSIGFLKLMYHAQNIAQQHRFLCTFIWDIRFCKLMNL